MGELLAFYSAAGLISKYLKREISPLEVAKDVLARIELWNPELKAYLSVSADLLELARKAEQLLKSRSSVPPLIGLPVSIKDNISTRGLPLTAGSRLFGEGLRPASDATVVRRLREAGALIVGKNHLHEFAFGITNENEHFGPCRNPWDRSRVSGGSSGGSAVAVAAGLAYASLGTDTRGSVRIPSACCGVCGLKPTRNLIALGGVIPLSTTLDHVGPIARSVEDLAFLLPVLSGRRLGGNSVEVAKTRLGILTSAFHDLPTDLEDCLERAIELFRKNGFEIEEVRLQGWDEIYEASTVVAGAEAISYHEAFLKSRSGAYGEAVRSRLERGYSYRAVDYLKAQDIRRRSGRLFARLFAGVDCLLLPGLPVLPPRVGSGQVQTGSGSGDVLHHFVRLHAPQNMAGVPSLVLPCGFVPSGLPVSLQLVAARHREPLLLELGAFFQRHSDWHLRRPPGLDDGPGPRSLNK